MSTTANACEHANIVGPEELAVMTTALDAPEIWRELTIGRARITELRETAHSIVASISTAVPKPKVSVKTWQILEAMLMGEPQKCTAMRLRVSTSTVSLHARMALQALGFDCRPSRAPLFLYMLFQAASGGLHFDGGYVVVLDEEGLRQRFVYLPRPDVGLDGLLSPAETSVARQRLIGTPSASIGYERHTTPRTVANQLANTYRKLGVSGRGELIRKVLARTCEAPSPRSLALASQCDALRCGSAFRREATLQIPPVSAGATQTAIGIGTSKGA